MVYPLDEYTGQPRVTDWPAAPTFLRAYWPGRQILDGTWTPPPATRSR